MSANAIIGIGQRVSDTARPVEAGPCAGSLFSKQNDPSDSPADYPQRLDQEASSG